MKVYNSTTSPVEGIPLFVPGAGIDAHTGELLGRSIARVDVAIDGVLQGLTPALIFSGGKAEGNMAPSEAEAMDDYLLRNTPYEVKLPPRFLETESVRSIRNLAYSVPLLREAGVFTGWMELGIVTDEAHMPRLLHIAGKILPKEVRVFPVITGYKATDYELQRERLARPITSATLAGLPDGAGPERVMARDRHYGQAKGVAKKVLRRSS